MTDNGNLVFICKGHTENVVYVVVSEVRFSSPSWSAVTPAQAAALEAH